MVIAEKIQTYPRKLPATFQTEVLDKVKFYLAR